MRLTLVKGAEVTHPTEGKLVSRLRTWRHAVGVHGVLVEVGGVEVGGNLGRDGDVEVAQAQALPVEAVEPPAIEHNVRPCSLRRG